MKKNKTRKTFGAIITQVYYYITAPSRPLEGNRGYL
jgi:hypothetical protein